MALSVPLSRFTSRVGGGSAFSLGSTARMNNSSPIGSAWIPIAISVVALIAFAGFIVLGIVRIMQERSKRRELQSWPHGHFVFAKIIDHILPMERGAKYERPLHAALHTRGLGIVTGSGTQMSRDGSKVEWVGIDIDLRDLDGALAFTRDYLRELGAPSGSVLEYRAGEQKITVQI